MNDSVARMLALNSVGYPPDDILVKADRTAMAVSLETHAPFLDKDLVKFGWALLVNLKQRNRKHKWLLALGCTDIPVMDGG